MPAFFKMAASGPLRAVLAADEQLRAQGEQIRALAAALVERARRSDGGDADAEELGGFSGAAAAAAAAAAEAKVRRDVLCPHARRAHPAPMRTHARTPPQPRNLTTSACERRARPARRWCRAPALHGARCENCSERIWSCKNRCTNTSRRCRLSSSSTANGWCVLGPARALLLGRPAQGLTHRHTAARTRVLGRTRSRRARSDALACRTTRSAASGPAGPGP